MAPTLYSHKMAFCNANYEELQLTHKYKMVENYQFSAIQVIQPRRISCREKNEKQNTRIYGENRP